MKDRNEPPAAIERSWHVLLLGGASGVGKTAVSYRLAGHFGVGLTGVDDFQIVLEHMTTPEQYPPLHRWRLRPDEVLALDDAAMLRHTLDYAEVMAQALEPVIGSHIESESAILLEGDFLLPSLATLDAYDGIPADGRVRGLFLLEDEAQIASNFRTRDGEEQPRRAAISSRYSEWLGDECRRLGVPAVSARPWSNVFKRAIEAIR